MKALLLALLLCLASCAARGPENLFVGKLKLRPVSFPMAAEVTQPYKVGIMLLGTIPEERALVTIRYNGELRHAEESQLNPNNRLMLFVLVFTPMDYHYASQEFEQDSFDAERETPDQLVAIDGPRFIRIRIEISIKDGTKTLQYVNVERQVRLSCLSCGI